MDIQKATLIRIIPRKIWIESDFCGSRHVMMQDDLPDEQPFCYASFHYRYGYTDNGTVRAAAIAAAKHYGAVEPIDERHRGIAESMKAMPTLPEWQPISTAPKDGMWIQLRQPPSPYSPQLVIGRSRPAEEAFAFDADEFVWPYKEIDVFAADGQAAGNSQIMNGDFFSSGAFTHWMPLPKPPTE